MLVTSLGTQLEDVLIWWRDRLIVYSKVLIRLHIFLVSWYLLSKSLRVRIRLHNLAKLFRVSLSQDLLVGWLGSLKLRTAEVLH